MVSDIFIRFSITRPDDMILNEEIVNFVRCSIELLAEGSRIVQSHFRTGRISTLFRFETFSHQFINNALG